VLNARPRMSQAPPSLTVDSPTVNSSSQSRFDWSLPTWHMTWPLAHLSACVARYRLGIKSICPLFEILEISASLENSYLIHFKSEKYKWYTKMITIT
jgi:hypothetical protein